MNLWQILEDLKRGGLVIPDAPAPCADLAAEYEQRGEYKEAAALWLAASAKCLGHNRAERYESASDRCLKKVVPA